jgi:hypothetical protein
LVLFLFYWNCFICYENSSEYIHLIGRLPSYSSLGFLLGHQSPLVIITVTNLLVLFCFIGKYKMLLHNSLHLINTNAEHRHTSVHNLAVTVTDRNLILCIVILVMRFLKYWEFVKQLPVQPVHKCSRNKGGCVLIRRLLYLFLFGSSESSSYYYGN